MMEANADPVTAETGRSRIPHTQVVINGAVRRPPVVGWFAEQLPLPEPAPTCSDRRLEPELSNGSPGV